MNQRFVNDKKSSLAEKRVQLLATPVAPLLMHNVMLGVRRKRIDSNKKRKA